MDHQVLAKYQPVIGLEVHIQLSTKSKLFSTSATKYGQHQNTQAAFLDLGLPGTLPVVNKEVIRKASERSELQKKELNELIKQHRFY